MITELRLQDFRCFASLRLELPETGAVFVGQNAQGKTSILEAICVLIRLHSPRSHRMGRLIKVEQSRFGIAGEVLGVDKQVRYAPGKGGGLALRQDAVDVSASKNYLQDGALIVWMGNEDLELVRGGAEARRHYLDFICGQISLDYRRALFRYRRALKARNLLLKDRILRKNEIEAYTKILIAEGAIVQASRESVVLGLIDSAAHSQAVISGRDERLELDYVPSGGQRLRDAYEQAWESEVRQRQTIVGPHRDDLKISINGLSASDYASEGQQRTGALALKLAQGQLLQLRGQQVPIYLLDDIFGELDSSRRNALMELLPQEAQKLITTTTINWLEKEDGYKIFHVSDATVCEGHGSKTL